MKKFFPNLVYLLLSLPLGILYFVVLVTGFSLGAGLAITIIGLPVLATMIVVNYLLGDLERSVTSKLLGINIVKPEARAAKNDSIKSILAAQLLNLNFWKEFVYLLLKMPLGVISFTIAVVFVTVSLSFIASPFIVQFFPDVTLMVGNGQVVDTMQESLLLAGAGLVMGAISVFIVNGWAKLMGWLASWALGTSGKQ